MMYVYICIEQHYVNSYCYAQTMWMIFILCVKLAIWITVRGNEQHLSVQTTTKKRIDLGRFQGSLRKKATLTDGGPEGLPEVTYSIRVLRTMKKNERDGSEMGPKSGEKRARTVGCTNSIDRTHRYYLQHAVHKLKLTPRTYYWHL